MNIANGKLLDYLLSEKEICHSHTLSIACTLGIVVLPVIHAAGLNTLSLKYLFTIWVLFLTHLLECFILSLSLKGPCDFLFS
jgi:hypothetical protein